MGLREFDWSQLPEIPVDTQVQHGPFGSVETTKLWTRGGVVATIKSVVETDEGIYAEGVWNDNSVKCLVERFPATIEDFSYFATIDWPQSVDTGKIHGPYRNTPANRLLASWEEDPDVPGYILDEFKQFIIDNKLEGN